MSDMGRLLFAPSCSRSTSEKLSEGTTDRERDEGVDSGSSLSFLAKE